MTNHNLPPGVGVNDLPGSTPNEIAWEKFHEEIDGDCTEYGLSDLDAMVVWKMGLKASMVGLEYGAVYPQDSPASREG